MNSPRHRNGDVVLRDGSTVHVRSVRAEDASAVRVFFKGLSPESIALRFFCGFPDLDRAVRWATEVDDQHRYGLVATSGADGRGVAPAGWEPEPDPPQRAEIAFAIADGRSEAWSWWNWRHRGRRRRWSTSNRATVYQATANEMPASGTGSTASLHRRTVQDKPLSAPSPA